MKILMTNHSLGGVGGTEKWTYYMARELVNLGHKVNVFAFEWGLASDKLSDFCGLVKEPSGDYDLVLTNHNTCLNALQTMAPCIHTSHGPSNPLEHPHIGADAYVGVSEEVRLRALDFGYDLSVITNGIDLDEYRPKETKNDRPKVLSMCKGIGATRMLNAACASLGYDFDWIHWLNKPLWESSDRMRDADIVVGMGRTAIEGMACGKEVLVFDARDDKPRADGWITKDNVGDLRRANFSGRRRDYNWGMPQLLRQLEAYEPSGFTREWAEEHADVHKKAGEYLAIHARMSNGSD